MCEGFKNKLIHISTDYVYSFSPQNAKETDLPVPLPNWYGHSKVVADSLIQAIFPDERSYLILRGTFKPTPYTNEKAWYNLTGNFDYVDVMASLMIKLIENDAYGIYNVGTEKKNLYELAKRTKPDVRMDDGSYSVNGYHRPYNTTMNLTKMNEFFDAIKR
jgi:dTDP-4-dehydrorhamnose reductase